MISSEIVYPLDQFLELSLEEASQYLSSSSIVFWIRHVKTLSRIETEMSEKSLPTVRHGSQHYPDDSSSWDAKNVQHMIDRERRQCYAPVLLRFLQTGQDPAMFPFEKTLSRLEMVPTVPWQDETKNEKGNVTMCSDDTTAPPPPRNLQVLRSVSEASIQSSGEPGE